MQGKHPDDDTHTRVVGECRAPEMRSRQGRPRESGPVRDPAGRASGDASNRRRITYTNIDDPAFAGDMFGGPQPDAAEPARVPSREEEAAAADPAAEQNNDDEQDDYHDDQAADSRATRADAGIARPQAANRIDAGTQEGRGGREDWRTD